MRLISYICISTLALHTEEKKLSQSTQQQKWYVKNKYVLLASATTASIICLFITQKIADERAAKVACVKQALITTCNNFVADALQKGFFYSELYDLAIVLPNHQQTNLTASDTQLVSYAQGVRNQILDRHSTQDHMKDTMYIAILLYHCSAALSQLPLEDLSSYHIAILDVDMYNVLQAMFSKQLNSAIPTHSTLQALLNTDKSTQLLSSLLTFKYIPPQTKPQTN